MVICVVIHTVCVLLFTCPSQFSCLLAILAVVEIAAGVFAYMRSDEVREGRERGSERIMNDKQLQAKASLSRRSPNPVLFHEMVVVNSVTLPHVLSSSLCAVQVGEQLAKFYMTVYAQYVDKGDPGLAVTLSMFHNVVKIKPIPKLLMASQL